MPIFYSDHARLMANFVPADHVGGFVVSHLETNTETLYALRHDGKMFTRDQMLGAAWFNKPESKWTEVESIPENAQWMGSYKREGGLA